MSELRHLIERITQCPEVQAAWSGELGHPCRRVVDSQKVPHDEFQVPEPWAGHVSKAPLLFISSNPSISSREPYPRWADSAESRVDFFEDRFGPGRTQVMDGIYGPLTVQNADGTWHRRRPTTFWNICKRNAAWVYGRDVVPGDDYAMTEVVHCKSKAQKGVRAARGRCIDRWLEPVLRLSPAAVLVLVGEQAQSGVGDYVNVSFNMWSVETLEIAGRERLVLTVRNPGYHGPSRWIDNVRADDRRRLHEALVPAGT